MPMTTIPDTSPAPARSKAARSASRWSLLSLIACSASLSAGGYNIERYTVDSGGGHSAGGAYAIGGSIGQTDADPLQPSTGGNFEVIGGFWPGQSSGGNAPDALFDDGFEG